MIWLKMQSNVKIQQPSTQPVTHLPKGLPLHPSIYFSYLYGTSLHDALYSCGRVTSFDTSEDQVSLESRVKVLINKIESMPNKNWRSEYSDVVFEIADLMAFTKDLEVYFEMCSNGLKARRENMVIESSGCDSAKSLKLS